MQGNRVFGTKNYDHILQFKQGVWETVFTLEETHFKRNGNPTPKYFELFCVNDNTDTFILKTHIDDFKQFEDYDTIDYHLLIKDKDKYKYAGLMHTELSNHALNSLNPHGPMLLLNTDSSSDAWIIGERAFDYKFQSVNFDWTKYVLFKYSGGRIERKNDLILDSAHFPELFKQIVCPSSYRLGTTGWTGHRPNAPIFNHARTKMLLRAGRVPIDPKPDFVSDDSIYFLQFDFDAVTGDISFDKVIYRYKHCKLTGVRKIPNCECFDAFPQFYSPDDQVLYAYAYGGYYPSKGYGYRLDSINQVYLTDRYILQFDVNSKENEPVGVIPLNSFIDSKNFTIDLKFIGPDAKLYIMPYVWTPKPNSFSYQKMYRLKFPDKLGALSQLEIVKDTLLSTNNWRGNHQDHPYLSLDVRETKCTQKVAFNNQSPPNRYEKFMLFFGDGDSAVLKNSHDSVNHTYKNPGTYAIWLRATTAHGYVQWREYEHTVGVAHTVPKAVFTSADTAGCQWIAFQFQDKSEVRYKYKPVTYTWLFGDGNDTMITYPQWPPQNPTSVIHTYTKDGLYPVSLVVYDGYCADTVTMNREVRILPAPQPGITLNALSGCSPLGVTAARTYADPIDSLNWNWGDGQTSTVFNNPAEASHIYNHSQTTDQKYTVIQTLFGPTGCVTQDSQEISVRPGFEKDYIPSLIRASVEGEKEVQVQWHKHENATFYHLYKNSEFFIKWSDTIFKEPFNSPRQDYYQIEAVNVCDQKSPMSRIGKLIELQGQTQNNRVALLQWTAYEDWPDGVAHYRVETKRNGVFETLHQTGVKEYTDNEYIESGAYERCYRIAAVRADKTDIISHSNTLCLEYESVIFVPNAFSPNDDGVNDEFVPFNIGLKEYTLSIYNRWGEKISEGKLWDGKIAGQAVPNGLYIYRITGKTGKDEQVFMQGEVMVVR
jgi:gliding motility-associated-like protein